jgi:ABC-type multidrug transport system ATPase subunit
MHVELEDVGKRFGKLEALRGVSLSLPAGQRVALVGPNGSGKSTLIRALLGLIACEGEVRLDGRAPFEDRLAVTRRLAYVPQVAPQLSSSVAELCALVALTRGLEPDRIRQKAALLALDLPGIAQRPFRQLSGGMKQKLLLALALASEATLFVLDEPTASLDALARERFYRAFAALPAQTTLLICSHRLEELERLVDRVVALEEGRVTYQGDAAAYLAWAPQRDGRLTLVGGRDV